MSARSRFILGVAPTLCLAVSLFGQHTDSAVHNSAADKSQAQPGVLSRWLDLQSATLSFRDKAFTPYTTIVEPWTNQVQYSALFAWRFKFDSKEKFQLGFAAGTGRYFTSSWLNTGIGPYLRQLYFMATPARGLEFQYGGFGFVRGDWTSITDFTDNGYLMGERVRIRRPDKVFFDEISITAAALKDLQNPDVFDRFHHLDKVNYFQGFVTKKVTGSISLSGGYDAFTGYQLLHQAVKVSLKNKKMPLADTILFENYQQLNGETSWGFGLTLQKTLFSRLELTGGVSSIGQDFVPLNSERLGRGHRVYLSSSYRVWRELSISAIGTKAFALDFPISYEKRFDVWITYDLAKALKRAHLF
jgi:hypothetical protein